MRELTTTSYAVLGLLALRPWSAYDLTKQAQRSLRFCWPRAETRLYQEPKNLVLHGFAKATVEAQGRRTRTVYSITPKGRKALRAWLDEPSAAPRLESEALLRLFFAEHGSKEALLATLTQLQQQASDLRRQSLTQATEYLENGAPFPERIHILGLVGKFMLDQMTLMVEWAQWARAEVEGWPDVGEAPVSEEVLAAFAQAIARHLPEVPERGELSPTPPR